MMYAQAEARPTARWFNDKVQNRVEATRHFWEC